MSKSSGGGKPNNGGKRGVSTAPARPTTTPRAPAKQAPPPAKTPSAGSKANAQKKQGSSAAGTFGAAAAGSMAGAVVGSAIGSAMTGPRGESGAAGAGSEAAVYGACADQLYAVLDCANRRKGNLDDCNSAMDELFTCHQNK